MSIMRKIALALFFAFLALPAIFSQPKITVNLTGGYNLPLPHLKGDVSSETERDNTYLIKSGFNGGITGKYALDKKGMFRITLGASYNRFSGEGSYVHTNKIAIHTQMNIITAGVGAEYAFMPKGKTNPFLGIDFTGNFFSGEIEQIVTAPSTVDHDDIGTTTTKINSASRFGIAIGGGADFALSKTIGALIGFKYSIANLIGKSYTETPGVGNTGLNDKEHTHGTETISSRNISFLQIYGGVSFYFCRPKKMVKK